MATPGHSNSYRSERPRASGSFLDRRAVRGYDCSTWVGRRYSRLWLVLPVWSCCSTTWVEPTDPRPRSDVAHWPVTTVSFSRVSSPTTPSPSIHLPTRYGRGWCRWDGIRGGWYTARWVDQLLFPANWASADRIVPRVTVPSGWLLHSRRAAGVAVRIHCGRTRT